MHFFYVFKDFLPAIIYQVFLSNTYYLSKIFIVSSLVWFYGISTIVGYLKSNLVYTYILNIYMICKYIWLISFLNEPQLILLQWVKWFQVIQVIDNIRRTGHLTVQCSLSPSWLGKNIWSCRIVTDETNIAILLIPPTSKSYLLCDLIWFVGYLMPNPLYAHILDIYVLYT